MVARGADVQNRKQTGRLSAGGAQRAHAALQRRDFLFHRRDGGVGDAGIHVAVRRKVEQLADVLGGIIGVGGALVDRQVVD